MKLESLKINKMASGNLSLDLTEDVTWENFPEKAREFLNLVKGKVLFKSTLPDSRSWVVLIHWRPFFLTFDDMPWGMTLDSLVRFCNPLIERLYKDLKA